MPHIITAKLIVIGIVFLLGFYFIYRTNDLEAFTAADVAPLTKNCPDVLIQKGSAFFLYNSKRANVPGVNPIRFENLEEYTEFTDWQRSQGIICPILYLQHAYNAQGDAVYKARPSPTNMQGGLPDYYVQPESIRNESIRNESIRNESIRNESIRNESIYKNVPVNPTDFGLPLDNYPGFDAHNQSDCPIDKMYTNQVSPNPMDSNWGGIEYTEKLIESGYYSGSEVSKVSL
jgi:hypothetical protein